MDDLIKKFEKMQIQLAERVELLSAKVEGRGTPSPRTPTLYRTQENSPISRGCYRCGEFGHMARNCVSEKVLASYIPPNRQKNKRVNYLTIETSDESSESEVEEETVYVGQRGRPPYNTNRKEAKERAKQSESAKELNLRSRKVRPQPMEIEETEDVRPIPMVSLTQQKQKKPRTKNFLKLRDEKDSRRTA